MIATSTNIHTRRLGVAIHRLTAQAASLKVCSLSCHTALLFLPYRPLLHELLHPWQAVFFQRRVNVHSKVYLQYTPLGLFLRRY